MASDIALALGIGNTWTSPEGESFELSLFTWRMIAYFERWVKDDAWRDVERTRPETGEDTYWERHALVTRLTIPLCYRGSAVFEEAWLSPAGVVYQTFLRARRYRKTVALEQVQGWYDGPRAADLVHRIAEMEQEQADASSPRRKGRRARKSKGEAPFKSVCAILVGEPWCRSLRQIGSLTPWQTNEVYFHKRYPTGAGVRAGQVILSGDSPIGENGDAVEAMEAFVLAEKKKGLSDEAIEVAWMRKLATLAGD